MAIDGGPELYHLPGFYEPFNAISHLLATVVFSWCSAERPVE